MDDNNILAEFLHVIHLMTGKDHQFPLFNLLRDDFLQDLGVHRIQS